MSETKKRFDALVQEMHPDLSRSYIQQCIKAGRVLVDGIAQVRPGGLVSPTSSIELLDATPKFVSRGGFKLEAALDHFKLNVSGLVALDAGISTGGFTDCLLQRGVTKVYGIEVGSAQVHPSIASDPRVILRENTNLREIKSLPEPIDLATLDLSFISLTKIIPNLAPLIKSGGMVIALIKPQFESEKHEVRRGGIINDPTIHERVKKNVTDAFASAGFPCVDIIESPLHDSFMTNQEFLGLFKKSA